MTIREQRAFGRDPRELVRTIARAYGHDIAGSAEPLEALAEALEWSKLPMQNSTRAASASHQGADCLRAARTGQTLTMVRSNGLDSRCEHDESRCANGTRSLPRSGRPMTRPPFGMVSAQPGVTIIPRQFAVRTAVSGDAGRQGTRRTGLEGTNAEQGGLS
ncbi:MAG: hypothetical protein IPM54_20180 [Polyangiaceae bacterium]|nr:hypothetical protein [Polyangiaceae bacterium]